VVSWRWVRRRNCRLRREVVGCGFSARPPCDLLISMDAAIGTAVVAVLGTLLGSAMAFIFQRKSSERAERFALYHQLRAERMNVYSDFGGAIAEARRGQYDWWNRRNEEPESQACFEARVEAFRLRGVAAHALVRVKLVASNQTMIASAQRAYDLTSHVHRATTETELRTLGKQAAKTLDDFIALASRDVKGDADLRSARTGEANSLSRDARTVLTATNTATED